MEAEKAPGMQQQQMAFSDTLDDAAQSVEMELVGALPLPFYRCFMFLISISAANCFCLPLSRSRGHSFRTTISSSMKYLIGRSRRSPVRQRRGRVRI